MARASLFRVLAYWPCLIGALLGGFPGVLLAYQITVISKSFGQANELVVFCLTTVTLSIGSAFVGMFIALAIRERPKIGVVEVGLPFLLGTICGVLAYLFVITALEHAEPPL